MRNIQIFDSKSTHNDELYKQIYELTDFICTFYPKHKDWFFNTFLPELKSGERIIIAVFDENAVPIGTALLKKSPEEHKICTLFIHEDWRKHGLGNELMKASVEALEGADTFISVSGVNLSQLQPLLTRYGFVLDSKSSGDYLPEETEYYFVKPQ